ncbi:MAG TPA: hypothetical protein VFT43_11690, partial [Candidatus Polarisedimenticolia bacterium]|nr:hypothetical protein [Candidatus Polarisedimenticolia bacterium]
MSARGEPPFHWDLVLKVGGSLMEGAALRPLLARLARLAGRRRLLVIPGGGPFADQARAAR